ncbi:hypothetical protein VaNZ11_010928 [Volvox africanus]|uniref:RING-type domain-containing protein n=1 Tax=Volvox africanus TaxID=51714 RepID=A0ABQ5SAM9_9CHLO|nr:hypothetical protein VaNZ11_010928 [Volvox africanus]
MSSVRRGMASSLAAPPFRMGPSLGAQGLASPAYGDRQLDHEDDFDVHGARLMSPRVLHHLCRTRGHYLTPACNTTLYLQALQFRRLENLQDYVSCRVLHLSNNCLSRIEGLDSMTGLQALYLQTNDLRSLDGLAPLTALHTLHLSNNPLGSLAGLPASPALRTLHAANTGLSSAGSLSCLAVHCPNLEVLDLSANPYLGGREVLNMLCDMKGLRVLYVMNTRLQEIPNLRRILVSALPRLSYLDNAPVDECDRRGCEAWLLGGTAAEKAARLAYRAERRLAQKRSTVTFAVERARRRALREMERAGNDAGALELILEDTEDIVRRRLAPAAAAIGAFEVPPAVSRLGPPAAAGSGVGSLRAFTTLSEIQVNLLPLARYTVSVARAAPRHEEEEVEVATAGDTVEEKAEVIAAETGDSTETDVVELALLEEQEELDLEGEEELALTAVVTEYLSSGCSTESGAALGMGRYPCNSLYAATAAAPAGEVRVRVQGSPQEVATDRPVGLSQRQEGHVGTADGEQPAEGAAEMEIGGLQVVGAAVNGGSLKLEEEAAGSLGIVMVSTGETAVEGSGEASGCNRCGGQHRTSPHSFHVPGSGQAVTGAAAEAEGFQNLVDDGCGCSSSSASVCFVTGKVVDQGGELASGVVSHATGAMAGVARGAASDTRRRATPLASDFGGQRQLGAVCNVLPGAGSDGGSADGVSPGEGLPEAVSDFNIPSQQRTIISLHVTGLSECVVCSEAFLEEQLVVLLPCHHFFHDRCIRRWLLGFSNSCPMCRAPVLSGGVRASSATATRGLAARASRAEAMPAVAASSDVRRPTPDDTAEPTLAMAASAAPMSRGAENPPSSNLMEAEAATAAVESAENKVPPLPPSSHAASRACNRVAADSVYSESIHTTGGELRPPSGRTGTDGGKGGDSEVVCDINIRESGGGIACITRLDSRGAGGLTARPLIEVSSSCLLLHSNNSDTGGERDESGGAGDELQQGEGRSGCQRCEEEGGDRNPLTAVSGGLGLGRDAGTPPSLCCPTSVRKSGSWKPQTAALRPMTPSSPPASSRPGTSANSRQQPGEQLRGGRLGGADSRERSSNTCGIQDLLVEGTGGRALTEDYYAAGLKGAGCSSNGSSSKGFMSRYSYRAPLPLPRSNVDEYEDGCWELPGETRVLELPYL